jgi:hypothetical protein
VDNLRLPLIACRPLTEYQIPAKAHPLMQQIILTSLATQLVNQWTQQYLLAVSIPQQPYMTLQFAFKRQVILMFARLQ